MLSPGRRLATDQMLSMHTALGAALLDYGKNINVLTEGSTGPTLGQRENCGDIHLFLHPFNPWPFIIYV